MSAANWIKMRVNLTTHPKVMRLSKILGMKRRDVIGALFLAWSIADQHATADGRVAITVTDLDDLCETDGFAEALRCVGWLEVDGEDVCFVNYVEHNGSTGKNRALAQKRKAKERMSRSTVTRQEQTRQDKNKQDKTREEKRRGELTIDSCFLVEASKIPQLKDYCFDLFVRGGPFSKRQVKTAGTRDFLLRVGFLASSGAVSEAFVQDGLEGLRRAEKRPRNAVGYLRAIWQASPHAPEGADPDWFEDLLARVVLPEGALKQ